MRQDRRCAKNLHRRRYHDPRRGCLRNRWRRICRRQRLFQRFWRTGFRTLEREYYQAICSTRIDEALKLESALARLRTDQRVALLHYAPIAATVVGEPPEIFPFLGCSRLEEPLNRYAVTAVIHGHAHRGTPEGRTRDGAPVYNVAMKLLESAAPTRQPYRILELPVSQNTSIPPASTPISDPNASR